MTQQSDIHERLKEQGQIILAIDGVQPDVGHEVLWVLRDCLSGEVLLARSLLSACEAELASFLREVQQVVASVASRLHPFSGPELCPTDFTRWRVLRSELNHRHEARRMQRRFRMSLEEKLIKERLPS